MSVVIRLEDLYDKAPALTPAYSASLIENCVYCLHLAGHASGVRLKVDTPSGERDFELRWAAIVTEAMDRSYQDWTKRVDLGACALALLLAPEIVGLQAVSTSAMNNGLDYYLGVSADDSNLIFNDLARLEVSGIQKQQPSNTIAKRFKEKQTRRLGFVAKSPSAEPPTYICVVEFGEPRARFGLA
jgi:hypothetical protein